MYSMLEEVNANSITSKYTNYTHGQNKVYAKIIKIEANTWNKF